MDVKSGASCDERKLRKKDYAIRLTDSGPRLEDLFRNLIASVSNWYWHWNLWEIAMNSNFIPRTQQQTPQRVPV
jgi:hypothetical protein